MFLFKDEIGSRLIQMLLINDFVIRFQLSHNSLPPLRNLNIPSVVTIDDNEELIKPIIDKEIHEVLSQMDLYKAPKPNGFDVVFY